MNKLVIRNVTKQFHALKAVDNLSIALTSGKIYGLIGPNGSGKTTLFNCISGIYKPDYGEIIFNDVPIHGKSQQKIAQLGIRRTFQTIRLYQEMTVAENIYSGHHTHSKQNIFHALTHLGNYKKDEASAWEQVKKWAGYFQLLDELHSKVGSLAYGVQRKVEMARAMIANPQILIFDEPAAGMNEVEKLELAEMILSLQHEGLIILMIEHDMQMVNSICQQIFVLNMGKLIAAGTPAYIQSHPQVIKAYMGQ